MATLKKTDTSFENTFRSFSKATKEYTEGLGESIEKLKDKVDSYSAAVARGEKIDTVARLKAEKSYQAALAVKAESEENDLKKLNKFHRMLAFGERKWDRIQKKKWMGVDLKDRRQFADTGVGKMLLKMGNSWEKFTNTKLYKVASSTYERLKGHAESIFDEILGPAKQVFDLAKTSIQGIYKGGKAFLTLLFPFLKKLGGMFDKKKDDPVKDKLSEKLSKIYEQAGEISKLLSENPTDKKLLKELSDLQKKATLISALIEKPTEKELTDKLKGIYDESGKISKQLAESGPDKALLDKLTELNTEAKDIRDQLKAKPSTADTKLLQEISEELKGQTAVLEHSLEQTQKEKLRQQLQGGDKKSGGFFSSLLDGFTGLFSSIGTGFMGVLSGILGGGALLGIFKAVLGIGGAAVAGYALGTVINKGINKVTESLTGEKTLGGYLWKKFNPKAAAAEAAEAFGPTAGSISQKYESGRGGAGMVSSGKGDPGGASYGTYQLASKTGTLQKFLKHSGYETQFAGLTPGTPEFNAKWKEIAKTDKDFGKKQHEFIGETHVAKTRGAAGVAGFNLGSSAINEALWSQGVQHSLKGNKQIIQGAAESLKTKYGSVDKASDEEQINALYAERTKYIKEIADIREKEGKIDQATLLRGIASNRMIKEGAEVVALSRKGAATQATQPVALSKQEAMTPPATGGAPVVVATEKELEQKKIANQKEIAALLKEERKEPAGPQQVVNMVQTGGGEQPTREREVSTSQIPSSWFAFASTQ